jgi:hypothetical protein
VQARRGRGSGFVEVLGWWGVLFPLLGSGLKFVGVRLEQ